MEALAAIMDGYSSTDFTKIFISHLAALPGWTDTSSELHMIQWQEEYPITLEDY
jgi:hypothetical protein